MKALFALTTLFLATSAIAADSDFLPPEALVSSAIAAQPEVRAAAAGVRGAHADARALAIGPNEWNLGLVPQRRRLSDGTRYGEMEAELTRGIRLPGKARLDREIGQLGTELADLELAEAEHRAARTLLEMWMDWLRAESTLSQSRFQRDLLQEDRTVIARRVAAGDAAARDLDAADALLAQAEAQATRAETESDSARTTLSGTFPQIPLPERAPALPEPELDGEDDTTHIAIIIERSHPIATAERQAERQAREAVRARSERRPDPTLGLRWLDEGDGNERALGLVLNVPIGGRLRVAQAKAREAQADAGRAQAEAMRRNITIEAEQTVRGANRTLRIWQDTRRALEATRAANHRTRRAYELGEAGINEWITAQRLDREAAQAELQARADALEAAVRIHIDAHELWHARDN